jgi:type II secretory pathway pseudopilin PulG
MISQTKGGRRDGFTIVELMLAMAFLSFILVYVATSLVDMLRSYDKGVTIKQISQASSTIGDDLSRRLRTAASTQEIIATHSDQGVLCVGNIAYVWNPLYKPNKTYESATRYYFTGGVPVSLARWYVANPQSPGSICNSPPASITRASDSQNYTLLSSRSRVLWTNVSRNNDSKLVKMTFYLGSYDSGENAALAATPAAAPVGVYNTPFFASAAATYPTCRKDTEGSYCFASSFVTTVYLPNALK